MQEQTPVPAVDSETPSEPDFDRFTSYEDGNDLVICDRKNPKAWIKSDTVSHADY